MEAQHLGKRRKSPQNLSTHAAWRHGALDGSLSSSTRPGKMKLHRVRRHGICSAGISLAPSSPGCPLCFPKPLSPKGQGPGGRVAKNTHFPRMLSVCLQCLCDLGKHGLWHCSISPCPFLTLAKVPLSDETCNPSIAPLTIVGQDGGSTQPRPDPEDRDDPKHLRMGTPGHKAAQGQRSVIPAAPPLPLSLGKEMPFKYYFISGSSGKLNPLGIVGVHRVQA